MKHRMKAAFVHCEAVNITTVVRAWALYVSGVSRDGVKLTLANVLLCRGITEPM